MLKKPQRKYSLLHLSRTRCNYLLTHGYEDLLSQTTTRSMHALSVISRFVLRSMWCILNPIPKAKTHIPFSYLRHFQFYKFIHAYIIMKSPLSPEFHQVGSLYDAPFRATRNDGF